MSMPTAYDRMIRASTLCTWPSAFTSASPVSNVIVSTTLPLRRVPVLAAGGIGTARALAAVLAAGAAGARTGTRFVAAAESDAHPEYVRALLGARAQDTLY